MGKDLCLLCGNLTGEFVGLCDSCCRVIKVKNEAFARHSRLRLEEFQLAEQRDSLTPSFIMGNIVPERETDAKPEHEID